MNELAIRLIVLALWLALTFNLVSNNLKRISFIQAYSTYSSPYRKLFIPVVYASYAVLNAIIPPLILGFLPQEISKPILFLYLLSSLPVFFVLLDFELHFSKRVQEEHAFDYPNERVIRIFMLEQIESEIDSDIDSKLEMLEKEIEILEKLERISKLSDSGTPLAPSDFVESIPIPREKSAVLLFAHSDNYLKLYHRHTEDAETLERKENLLESREELISVMKTLDPRKPNSEHKYIYVNNDKEEVEKFGIYVIPFDEWKDIQKVPAISEDVWEKAKVINLLENRHFE